MKSKRPPENPVRSRPERKNKKKLNSRRLLWILLSLAIMSLIFWFSSQNGEESSKTSGAFLFLLTWLVSPEQASFLIRKAAHFTIYFCLGFSLYGSFRSERSPQWKQVFYPLLTGILYAAGDEWHQSFTEARSAQLSDVVLDGCGCFLGVLTHALISGSSKRNSDV